MKNMPFRKIFIFLSLTISLSLLTGCANHQQQHTADHNKTEKHSPATQQRFTNIERWVKAFEDPARDSWQKPDEVVRTMGLVAGDVVADIGAGTGYFTRRFAVAVGPEGKALGLDIEQSMVKYMKEDAQKLDLENYEAIVIPTDATGLAPGSVDVIFLSNTYHHIENRVEYFKNASKNLKQNGRVIIVDFYKNTDFGPPRDHKLAKEVVLDEMARAGYILKKDLKILPHQYYLEYAL